MSDPPFRLDAFLPYRLSLAANRVSARIAGAYEAMFGLTIPQWRVIAIVAAEDGPTQAGVCAASGMDKVTVSRAAIALARRGLLARDGHASDGRAHALRLTAAGRALHAAIVPQALALEAELLAGFTPREVATLAALLRRLGDAAPPGGTEGAAPTSEHDGAGPREMA